MINDRNQFFIRIKHITNLVDHLQKLLNTLASKKVYQLVLKDLNSIFLTQDTTPLKVMLRRIYVRLCNVRKYLNKESSTYTIVNDVIYHLLNDTEFANYLNQLKKTCTMVARY